MNKYKVVLTNNFKKDLKLASKRNKNIAKLNEVVDLLSLGETLPIKYKDHALVNDKKYIDCRECHIEPDWLLVYKYDKNDLILLLVKTGSHSDLFK